MPSLSGPFFLRLIVSGCLILFAMAISPEAYSAADSSPMDVDAGYNLPPSDGGIPFPGNDSANTRTVDQKEYGEDCANAGIGDYSPTCGGQQTSEDPRDAQPKE
ncbi:MAG TPA: hypothetical protein PL182_14015, partial [Pseudobdellovibrionaceae bacterium]|nr:hypothetical protein [Pseudobdellovibrionaceae bacterium]